MSKSKAWFSKTRGSYLPKSWQGWLTYVPYVAYTLGVVMFVDHRKDSFWLGFFTVIPNWTAAAIIMTWIARRKS